MASVAADCSVAADMQQAALKKSQSMSWEQWRLRAIQAIMKCLLDELQQHQNVSDAVHVTLRTFHHFTTAYETLGQLHCRGLFQHGQHRQRLCICAVSLPLSASASAMCRRSGLYPQ